MTQATPTTHSTSAAPSGAPGLHLILTSAVGACGSASLEDPLQYPLGAPPTDIPDGVSDIPAVSLAPASSIKTYSNVEDPLVDLEPDNPMDCAPEMA